MTNILILICIIISIKLTPAAVLPQQTINLISCNFYYNVSNQADVGPYSSYCLTGSPCNCDRNTFSYPLLDETNLDDWFQLSDNSWLDFTVQLGGAGIYYTVSSIQIGWHNRTQDADDTKSFISIFDPNINDWVNVTKDASNIGSGIVSDITRYTAGSTDLTNSLVNEVRVHIEWNTPTPDGLIRPAFFRVDAVVATKTPTENPSKQPSKQPTTDPTYTPTYGPTAVPSTDPTVDPTVPPTMSPTWQSVTRQTKRIVDGPDANSYQFHSNNIIPLSQRGSNLTYKDYYLPDLDKYTKNGEYKSTTPGADRPYCVTCILAWADIDASIELNGCPQNDSDGNPLWDYNSTDPADPMSIWNCDNGTWVLKTSGRLADWQDTYGRLEIWEVDDRGIKWLQYSLEFNWWNDSCFLNQSNELVPCDVLPLTGTNKFAAYFEFSMPKKIADARKAPLIAVWYDLLSIPYSLQPELGYVYVNLSLYEPTQGEQFGLADVWVNFQPAIIAAAILFACFLAVMLLSCFVSGDKKTRRDFMIDTRNLKTTFRHTPETIIVPPSHIRNRARFSCARHGPWLLVVLVARLIYMFVFTFLFFYFVFQAINNAHYETLNQYDTFAVGRDAQLVDMSRDIEIYYQNETDRMEREVQAKNYWCFTYYLNATLLRFINGSQNQINYHTREMDDPLGGVRLNFTSLKEIFVVGDGKTACNADIKDGAVKWFDSRVASFEYLPSYTVELINATNNATYTETMIAENTTSLEAMNYNTSWTNFSGISNFLGPYCEEQTWCYGWGFWDKTATNNEQYYILFNEMADPPLDQSEASGVCYASTKLDAELDFLRFNASYFNNYADKLNAQYLDDFQSYTEDLYDTLQGIWTAVQDLPTGNIGTDGAWSSEMKKKQNLTSSANYDVDIDYRGTSVGGNTSSGIGGTNYFIATVGCPDCPQGNFTKNILQTAADFFFNGSNITDFTNLSELPVNFSNLISINTALIDFPDFPTIELPFNFTFPLDLSLILSISVTLDVLLLIYRWYRTTGIVARIVRGKDIDVSLTYLMVAQSKPKCCYGRSILDYCLNCVIYCHDKLFRLSYNLWKVFYWVWFLLKIAIVALIVLMLYYLVDQILTVEFIEGLGTFQLMTVGIGAQRTVRNQVICSTALGYNNYTLANLETAITHYAKERNEDAWQQNINELKRVDSWNALFCRGWKAYQTTPRDVTSESPNGVWVDLNDSDTSKQTKDEAILETKGTYYIYTASQTNNIDTGNIANLFDDDATTYWTPYPNSTSPANQDITFEFYLAPIYMTDTVRSSWDISQITFNWRFVFDETVLPKDGLIPIVYDIEWEDSNGILTPIEYPNGVNSYQPATAQGVRQSADTSYQYITIPYEISTRKIRITFQDVDTWGSEYYLNGIDIAGHAPESEFKCPEVYFRFWEFDASPTDNENATSYVIYKTDTNTGEPIENTYYDADGTYIELCPRMTPIHGLMYRGFVRRWLNEQLIVGHEPFILALRNIALSPFFIAVGLIGILFIAYLFAFIMEWFLMKLDLYRENPYARVPLVTTDYDKYDESKHETGDTGTIYGTASIGKDYYNPTVSVEDESTGNLLGDKHVDRNEIEMGLTDDPPNLTQRALKGGGPGGDENTYSAPGGGGGGDGDQYYN